MYCSQPVACHARQTQEEEEEEEEEEEDIFVALAPPQTHEMDGQFWLCDGPSETRLTVLKPPLSNRKMSLNDRLCAPFGLGIEVLGAF
jgi:hypothetical protein